MRILLIEDEPSIADTIVYALTSEGFEVLWKSTGREGLEHLDAQTDLVLLDVGLPDMSGFEVCRRLRRLHDQPVLFLTARNEEVDRIVGLEIGADDYITKPFSPRELCARVRAHLRRRPARATAEPVTDPVTTHPLGGMFRIDDESLHIFFLENALELTRTEHGILRALLEKPGRVLSREQLMDKAWVEPSPSLERTVDAHIRTLRAKLRAIAPSCDPIETRRGVGYCIRLP